ncbi:ubiquinol oxidase subunit II [Entomobacter blattae]|uniref:Ubiquinol oxidase subunit 2 n=1 Tax=Entomobacter blattae TaxID=2762277 RepID=A0A7H1NRX9_9PROT|nr:ubiquinol oxidase subunit II [Entomobacter blattae]QNT78539.1 Cytochrome bo(3) ubiquinol oxidase subunit 2 [Entomobacter blattae]
MIRKYGFWFRRIGLIPVLVLLSACDEGILVPKGPVGEEEKYLLLLCTAAMLLIVVPVIILSIIFAIKYRQKNVDAGKAEYLPHWAHSNKVEVVIWGIPVLMIAFLATLTWESTHSLDPYKVIPASDPNVKPLEIQVVAMDWKWLFIYPDEGLAVVNQVAIPVNRPVRFTITSDSVMNSFFIPQLGSMIYAMAGMQTQLNLMATSEGNYAGLSTNYSGRGFSDMKFRTLALPQEGYEQWIQKVKTTGEKLDERSLAELEAPSVNNPVVYYSYIKPGTFDSIVGRYNNGMVKDKETGKMIHVHAGMSGTGM